MNFANFRLQKINVLSLLLLVALCSSNAKAQNSQQNTVRPGKPRQQNVNQTEKLSQKVSINGLPDYSGKQTFVWGRSHDTPIGPQYQEQFIAMEPPTQILDWYKGALSSYKWQILDSDPSHVHAKKQDGTSIVITVGDIRSPKGRSVVKITYHDYHLDKGARQ